MLRRVSLVRTDVSEECGTSETSVLTRATQRNIPKDGNLHSQSRENLKSHSINRLGSAVETCLLLGTNWGFYIREDGILRSQTRGDIKS
jgi:ABC-type phosphonate transport system ATPase subunit